MHTPETIKNDVAKSLPVIINCNSDVKAKISIKGGNQYQGVQLTGLSVDMVHVNHYRW